MIDRCEKTDVALESAVTHRIVLPDTVALVARPGAGKDTHGDLMTGLGYNMFVTSRLLQRYAAEHPEDPDSARILDAKAAGGFAPDHKVMRIVDDHFEEYGDGDLVLANGCPRTPAQAELFRELLDRRGRAESFCLNIDVEPEIVIARAAARNRGPDDHPDVVRDRLKLFDEKTKPVLDWYGERSRLISVAVTDPEEGIQSVQRRLRAALEGVSLA